MKAALPYRPLALPVTPRPSLWAQLLDDRRLVRVKVLLIGLLLVLGAVLERAL